MVALCHKCYGLVSENVPGLYFCGCISTGYDGEYSLEHARDKQIRALKRDIKLFLMQKRSAAEIKRLCEYKCQDLGLVFEEVYKIVVFCG